MSDLPCHAILSNEAMGAADRATIDSGRFSGPQLMERAGIAVADIALSRWPAAPSVHVLCGPGNNGGDGYVAARVLVARGSAVRLYALAEPKAGTDAQQAASRWSGLVEPLEAFAPQPDDLVIDALFGAGFAGALPKAAKSVLDLAAASACPLLAVDLPSGINGNSGLGADAVPCEATVTFYRRKPGHLLYPGPLICGDITVADIGVRSAEPAPFCENTPGVWHAALPAHAATTHKYNRGAVAVWSGPRHGSGASRLAALAAQRGGAGAVTLLGHPNALDIHAAHVTSVMLRAAEPARAEAAHESLKGLGAVVVGPGFGDLTGAQAIVEGGLRRGSAAMIIDADAITAFAETAESLFLAAATAKTVPVLTPHEGEFARLFPDLAVNAAMGKLEKALTAASRASAVIVYKGPDTVIAAPDGRAAINTNATPALATAGSGDVLAGLVAGLAAQGMTSFEAACAAVWLHGEAGRMAGRGAIAEDLVAVMPLVWTGLNAS